MIIKIFTGPQYYAIKSLYQYEKNEFNIGVDRACISMIHNDIKLDLAVGDFDSVSDEEKQLIFAHAKNTLPLQSTKDVTDTHFAVETASQMNPTKMLVYGGLAKRIDHSLANIFLLAKYSLEIIDEHTRMYVLKPGNHVISNKHKYISFYAMEDILSLTLTGFKYDLHNQPYARYNPLCISNEGSGTVQFADGMLLVIHQDE